AWVQAEKIAINVRNTLVPWFLRNHFSHFLVRNHMWGTIREYGFVTYQLNLWFMIGSALLIAVIYSLCRPGRSAGADVRAFWITLYGVGIPLGIAVVGSPEDWGLGHICLQPLTLLAIAFATARFRTWP